MIIEEYDATCVVPPDATASLDFSRQYRHCPELSLHFPFPVFGGGGAVIRDGGGHVSHGTHEL